MFKTTRKKLLSGFLALIFVFTTVIPASAATLGVERVKQAKTKWCWAATSEMIGSYMNSSSGRTQWDIVAYVKGSSHPNSGGSVSDIKKAIKYASGDTITYTSGGIRSWNVHTSQIDNGNPLAVWMSWDGGSAHAVVCAGTKTTNGNNYLYIIDPWEDNVSQWYRYDSMKNGCTIQSGTGKYTTSFWKK